MSAQMSGLPESGRDKTIYSTRPLPATPCAQPVPPSPSHHPCTLAGAHYELGRGHPGRIRGTGRYGTSAWLVHLDIGRPDHVAPLLGLVRDQLAEVGRRTWKCGDAQ